VCVYVCVCLCCVCVCVRIVHSIETVVGQNYKNLDSSNCRVTFWARVP